MTDSSFILTDSPISSVPPRRPHLLALASAYALLAIYGNLVPLDFQPMPSKQVAQRVDEVLHETINFRSRSDILVNVMIAVPMSFLLMAGFCADRDRMAAFFAAFGVIPACVLFAACMEFLQLFFPPRVSSLNDIFYQGVGSCIGVLAWVFRGQTTIDWIRRIRKAHTAPGLAGLLLPSYVVLLFLMHIAPFDVITQPKQLVTKWRAGRIQLIPFQTWYKNPIEEADKALINFAYFMPVGLLWGLGPIRQKPHRTQVLHAAATGLLVAGSVEVLQLMVYSRNFEITDLLTGTLAVIAGAETSNAFRPMHDRSVNRRIRTYLGLAILAWLAALMNDYWRPFDFPFDSDL